MAAIRPSAAFSLYLLYLDESGNPDDVQDRHFVLAGAAVFERVAHFLSQAIDAVQTAHFPGVQPIPFHATEIRSGSGFWRGVALEKRNAVLEDLCGAVAAAQHPGMFLFASVIEKTATLYGEAAVKRATEEICVAFDRFLVRQYKQPEDPAFVRALGLAHIAGPFSNCAIFKLTHYQTRR